MPEFLCGANQVHGHPPRRWVRWITAANLPTTGFRDLYRHAQQLCPTRNQRLDATRWTISACFSNTRWPFLRTIQRVRDLEFAGSSWPAANAPVPQIIAELLGNYLDSIRMLARRTAEMHIALSSRADIADFAPEPFTTFYRQSIYHGMLGQMNRSFDACGAGLGTLPAEAQSDVSEVLNREGDIRNRLLLLRDKRHVGQPHSATWRLSVCRTCLFSGSDWIITNFEGDPYRPLSERRIKRSALRDVATMLRSFHYVSHAALFGDVPGIVPSREAQPQLEKWARTWYHWVSAIFLRILEGGVRAVPSCRRPMRRSRSCWALTCSSGR